MVAFKLDELEKEILASVSSSSTPFCCCSLLDTSLLPHQHLDGCELRLVNPRDGGSRSDSSANSETHEPPSDRQRRKHRECVARIRKKHRASIASLEATEARLWKQLRLTVAATNGEAMAPPRRAYLALVREQIDLEDERDQLESAEALRRQYSRLVQRELEKAQTFSVYPN